MKDLDSNLKDSRLELTSLTFDVDKIEQDVQELIKKHYIKKGTGNVSLLAEEGLGNEKGFYLIFIKREDSKDRDIKVTSFGSDVRFAEIIDAVSLMLKEMMEGERIKKIGVA